ncbi:baseplate J/gp47 family protein [Maledivibacter halophilus]|uniref:Uncharacterized phage protein gp47/JayE n=1 Tax=Maledivibacter halophilus TaxID=36842 RepID=A0A1T5KWL5_9FIRM|nr:baseplate J/gp47 family protein [Maledivibacter halophilus]SKC68071.1 Uncharacterized phage protein gp47/JayE [Maledivibacter halophilus]SKC71872.1 Uncharacterized phage protein gp47/JayE [Maledivibacter halophilus]SKC80115.1 Uncharacterized phage protein gp47/JayE [Maledivibacter halophilus]
MDEKDLNSILPIPNLDEMSNQVEKELDANDFKIKNFRAGKIFKALEMIFLKSVNELYKLLLQVVSMVFLPDAKGVWLDLKAREFGKERKQAIKTEGSITVGRNTSDGMSKQIPKGTIFKTDVYQNDKILRFISTKTVVMQADDLKAYIPVKAEFPGSIYNVSSGMIKYSVQHIPGIDYITNEINWLIKEGTDEESDDSLRKRCENTWAELAAFPIGDTYRSYVNNVNGVLTVFVDDQHPRGQGTIDIIVTGVAGLPTEALLQSVREKIEEIKGPYDDVLVYGPEAIYQDIDVTVYIDDIYGDETQIKLEAENIIKSLFTINDENSGNKLYRAKISHKLMSIENVINVIVNNPLEDVSLEIKNLIILRDVTVNVVKESS